MSLTLLFAALLVAAEPMETVPIAEREPLVLLVQAPERAAASLPELVRLAAPAFAKQTSFNVITPWEAGVPVEQLEACRADTIGCWYRKVARAKKGASVLLLAFVLSPGGARDKVEVATLYFDAKLAPNVETIPDDAELESKLLETVPDIERVSMLKNDGPAITKYFEDLVETKLKAALQRNNRPRDLGDIIISGPSDPLSIELDGKTSLAHGPRIRLQGVAPGSRSLIVREPGETDALYRGAVDVRTGESASVFVASPRSSKEYALWAGGAGLAAIGTALTIYAVTRSNEPVVTTCSAMNCAEVPRNFVPFCGRADCSGLGGSPIAPLGYSLILTGAIWIAGELLTSEELTWVPLVAGLVAGGATYGVSLAAD